ncbi:MAG: glycoside hydrolase family 3 C-terminal domain-containing protein [Defluviitaleaceae bacterium]|nr:glycoside hydrolase family 3 C-terminal domain-containing protein [Defluviitaleaceae bacterium]MCL2274728.1 glycoside hydrolase family 3 C-terminal domain-containing protein [Defluviitaleaceae bacterium]
MHKEYLEKSRALIAQMTVEEKVSQMLHTAPPIERLGIPGYNWWNEALHGIARSGTATVFPQAVGLAAAFDPVLLKEIATVISDEGRAKFHAYQKEGDTDIYKGLTFWSPNINIFRDPRWGRGHETYGEDPYLTSNLGVAFIQGLQGDDPENELKAAACAKHYAVHSGPEAERHSFNALCDDYDLWNTYLPHFEAAVKEGHVEAFMGAYNRTNHEPCCASEKLMNEILRGKWGFEGHFVSDCWAVEDFYKYHKIVNGPVESVVLAIEKGCDLCCGHVFQVAVQAVESGKLPEALLDRALERLFVCRMKLGLLGGKENPKYTGIPYDIIDGAKHKAFNLEVAKRTTVLLKNDGALPLDISKLNSIAVIGPNAASIRALEGNYNGTATQYITVLDGIREIADETGVKVNYALGCHLYKDRFSNLAITDDRIAEALAATRNSDAVVLCLGLDADIEGEQGDTGNEYSSGDKEHLNLPGRQQHLLEKVIAAAGGKPVIVVCIAGSALALNYADEKANGIIHAFYPGAMGGRAIAEIITGRANPSAKLPVTFYRSLDDLPGFSDYNMTNRTYRYFTGEPLYGFGFGLTYTKFGLEVLGHDKQTVKVKVTNNGQMEGREVLQVYVTSPNQKEKYSLCSVASVPPLKAGESTEITMQLSSKAFSRYDANGDLYEIAGPHTLHVGFTQPDARSEGLYGVGCVKVQV